MIYNLTNYIIKTKVDNELRPSGLLISIYDKSKYELFSDYIIDDLDVVDSDLLGSFLQNIEYFFLITREDLQGENEFFNNVLKWDKSYIQAIYNKHVSITGDAYLLLDSFRNYI